MGDETFNDRTLTQQEPFRKRADAPGASAGTSQPSPGTLVSVYEQALATADEVHAIHISSRLSGTYDLARTISQQFGGRVDVFDSRNLSWGSGWLVPVRSNRGDRAALRSIHGWISQNMRGAAGGSFAVGHAFAPAHAEELAEEIKRRWRVDEPVMYDAGSAITVHAGRIWGVAFRARP